VPAELGAEAEQHRTGAERAREQASQGRASAQALIATAEQEAAQITAAARAEALTIVAEATAADRRAAALEERGRYLSHAGQLQDLAAEAGQRAADLASEREHLEAKIAGLDGRLAELQADAERTAANLVAASDADDLDVMTTLRNRGASIADRVTALEGLRRAAQDRTAQIGDGAETGPGLLADALSTAETHRTAVTVALDELYPDRAGAHTRRALDDLKNTLEANRARIVVEAAAAQRKPQQIVHL
jgi:chromosome segregation ATPase